MDVKKLVEQFNTNLKKTIKALSNGRDAIQELIELASRAKIYDDNGEVGTSLLTQLTREIGDTRAVNITAIRDYISFIFDSNPFEVDEAGKPIVDPNNSCLLWQSGKDKSGKKKDRWVSATELKEILGDNGAYETKRIVKTINTAEVERRLKLFKWYAFNPARPQAAYKPKVMAAIKADLKAISEGRLLPDGEQELSMYKELKQVFEKYSR